MRATVFIGRRCSARPAGVNAWGDGGGGARHFRASRRGTAEKSRNNGEPRLAAKIKKRKEIVREGTAGADRPYLNRRYVVLGSHFGHCGDKCDDCGAGCITIS